MLTSWSISRNSWTLGLPVAGPWRHRKVLNAILGHQDVVLAKGWVGHFLLHGMIIFCIDNNVTVPNGTQSLHFYALLLFLCVLINLKHDIFKLEIYMCITVQAWRDFRHRLQVNFSTSTFRLVSSIDVANVYLRFWIINVAMENPL